MVVVASQRAGAGRGERRGSRDGDRIPASSGMRESARRKRREGMEGKPALAAPLCVPLRHAAAAATHRAPGSSSIDQLREVRSSALHAASSRSSVSLLSLAEDPLPADWRRITTLLSGSGRVLLPVHSSSGLCRPSSLSARRYCPGYPFPPPCGYSAVAKTAIYSRELTLFSASRNCYLYSWICVCVRARGRCCANHNKWKMSP